MNKNVWIGGSVIVVLVIVAAVLMKGPDDTAQDGDFTAGETETNDLTEGEYATGTPSLESDTVSVTPAAGATSEVKELTLTASEFKYSQTEIRVKKGDTVKIVLTNDGQMPHDWKVDELNAKTKIINGGQTDTVQFTADKAGTFEYYCSVGQHRQLGMVGKLVVE